ncbi:MAG: glycosyltransferase family 39 protein [Deltaproteobacteria bacterium]|nr:glycosyltransferase family 39 protein [Deltaproteobacteria bacterium]
MTSSRLPAMIAAAGLVAWITSAAIVWLAASPLGHDEAQYALSARDILAGTEARWFYLSSGMSFVSVLGVIAGDGEIAVRFPAVLLGIGFVLTAGGLAWRTYGAMTGAWTIAVLAGLRVFAGNAAELLSDLPATTFLLAGTLVMIEEVTKRDDGPRWRVLLAAPALAAALYLRYASCVPIALLGLAVLAFGFRSIAKRPLPVIATAALFLALLVPHLVTAMRETGSPLGILMASKGVPGQTWIAQGLATYLTSNPVSYYGLLSPLVLLPGIVAPAMARDRASLILWSVAIADIVALGLISHAQARYIFFGLTLLVILGIEVIRRVIDGRRAVVIAAATAVAISWILVARGQLKRDTYRLETTQAIRAAAAAIRADAGSAPCFVVGDQFTQLEWYSGCTSAHFPWDSIATAKIYVVRTPSTAPVSTRGVPTVIATRPDVNVTRYDP